MITVGMDLGTQRVHVVVLKDGCVVARSWAFSGFDPTKAAEQAVDEAVKCDEKGIMVDFVVNERCAAGAGAFIEAMARALEVKMEDMGPLALKAERASPINASCGIVGG